MNDEHSDNASGGGTVEESEKLPAMQRLLDNPFLLLFLGVTIPTVFYLIWGIMEIITIPISPTIK